MQDQVGEQYEYSIQDGQEPSTAVIHAVSIATDTAPLELPSLYEAVDPSSLDDLFSTGSMRAVSFDWAGCVVTVNNDETIIVDYDGIGK